MKRTGVYIIENVNVKDILGASLVGSQIIGYYDKHQRLTNHLRGQLVHTLMSKIVHDSPGDLENTDLDVISIKIKEAFPTESLRVYYIPPVPEKNIFIMTKFQIFMLNGQF